MCNTVVPTLFYDVYFVFILSKIIKSTFKIFSIRFVWVRITDEGSIPQTLVCSLLAIQFDLQRFFFDKAHTSFS